MNRYFNTKIIGKSFLYFDVLSSTNNYAIDLLKKGEVENGTVISAGLQTEGRGQRGTTWSSNSNENILLSIILNKLILKPTNQFILSKIIALSIYDFISDFVDSDSVSIKWPNDIYIENQKVAGVLIQNVLNGDKIGGSVIGIGVNINQVVFSSEMNNAVSLAKLNSKTYDLSILIAQLLIKIEHWHNRLSLGAFEFINSCYRERLFGMNQKRTFLDIKSQSKFDGMIMGVNESGNLLINSLGKTLSFDIKEVKFIFE